MSGAMSRRKGAGFERAVARAFAVLVEGTKRGLGQARGAEVPDVDLIGYWPELKAHKLTNPRAALAQAIEDSKGTDRVPIAICKDNNEPPFVIIRFEDFLHMFAYSMRAAALIGNPTADLFQVGGEAAILVIRAMKAYRGQKEGAE